ncbi:MAG: metallophosphatase family protein [Deltaproteobacteria bacterium]|nr:metallophosphatase family protein [Sandaracinaceae bacterium]MCX7808213.1 metallophosphatase family protein [Deltaproteobacteria bacterium]MDW8245936.1 metallophosphoesterase family protein [Sandaracinaceae bacterium]
MRLGIFSDVHANLEALSAVLEAYRHESIDAYYCLGDVVGYGANPNECADVVREIAKVTILGNHDAAVAGRMDYSYYYPAARQALDLHSKMLSEANMKWLKSLPYQHELPEAKLRLCHGSPLRVEEFEYIFAPEQARECLLIWEELPQLTLIGHSHFCKVFALRPGEVEELPARKITLRKGWKYIASVGSVGQPRDFDNRASYVVFDAERGELEFKRIEYDIQTAAQKIFDVNLDWSFGHRLFIGI